MRKSLLFTLCLLSICSAAPPATATPTHPLFGVTMWRQTNVGKLQKSRSKRPWVLMGYTDRTPFDMRQDNLKILAEFKEKLREKAKQARTDKKGAEKGGLGEVGDNAEKGGIGKVGGIAIVGGAGQKSPTVRKSIADAIAKITPEEAAAALADEHAREHPKTLQDILRPHKPGKMQELESKVFGHDTYSMYAGSIDTTPTGAPPPGSAPPPLTEGGKTATDAAPAPEQKEAAPAQKPNTGGAIGNVGGLGKVGPNNPKKGE